MLRVNHPAARGRPPRGGQPPAAFDLRPAGPL